MEQSEEEFGGQSDYVPYKSSKKPYGVPFKGGEPASRSLPPPAAPAGRRKPREEEGGVLTKMARSHLLPSCRAKRECP